ncbi:MAG: helix-turn-helix domain-containing protein [Actinobacteria bacterium]|nr:helix-turn-helix domain-containing protein [Actinomycetota bacterium]
MKRADFAAELARRRGDAKLSLAGLAALAHVHRGYLHRMERGERWPSGTVVRAVDTALGADGTLLATWEAADAAVDPDDFERFERALAAPQRTDAAVVEHLARVLAEQRRAEDALGARRLLPPVLAQLKVIEQLATDTAGPLRRELLTVGAHYEQFAAWMYQDSMDPAGARRHYGRAMDAAQEIDDADMVTSVLSLKSHLAWSLGDAASAVELAQAAQRDPRRVSDAVLALAAQQEARGHALDGDTAVTERALDRSAALTHAAAEHPDDAPPWVYFNDPDRLAFQRGVAYVELGRHTDAVPLLSTALEHLTNGYDRDRGRYAGMLALALAGAAEAEEAVACAKRAAELAVATGSALAARELRRVRTMLHEQGAQREVAALAEYLRALTVKP